MRNSYSARRYCGAWLVLCLLFVCPGNYIVGFTCAQAAETAVPGGPGEALPREITPEGVQALTGKNVPFILIDADGHKGKQPIADSLVRRIYYTAGPSTRAAQNLVAQDRKVLGSTSPEKQQSASQRLTGTPLEWQRLKLKFNLDPVPSHPLSLTPRQLAECIKDGVDLQIVDLRPPALPPEASPFPDVLQLLPHQLEGNFAMLSKQRWIVLIDGGNQVAGPIAESLLRHGYLLITVLEGGYPAWVAATGR